MSSILAPLAGLSGLDPTGGLLTSAVVSGASSDSNSSGTGSAVNKALSAATQTIFGFSVVNGVTIVVGLLFIAAGLFMFKPVRDVTIQAGKAAVA